VKDPYFPEFFPYKTVYNYLQDIKERERIIKENLMMISLSRKTIEKFLKCSEK
jgi:hypothetical protein